MIRTQEDLDLGMLGRAFRWLRRLIVRAVPTCTLWVRDVFSRVYRSRVVSKAYVTEEEISDALDLPRNIWSTPGVAAERTIVSESWQWQEIRLRDKRLVP